MDESSNLESYQAFAQTLADVARPIALGYFGTQLESERKADDSPVTAADREAEMAMRILIEQRYPDHGVLGEEFDERQGAGQYVWVLDPIDGTKAFITGKPLFGTLIALLEDEVPVVGVIELPGLARRFVAARNMGTFERDQRCHASSVTELGQARLGATTIDMFAGADREAFDALSESVWFRVFGSDCYA